MKNYMLQEVLGGFNEIEANEIQKIETKSFLGYDILEIETLDNPKKNMLVKLKKGSSNQIEKLDKSEIHDICNKMVEEIEALERNGIDINYDINHFVKQRTIESLEIELKELNRKKREIESPKFKKEYLKNLQKMYPNLTANQKKNIEDKTTELIEKVTQDLAVQIEAKTKEQKRLSEQYDYSQKLELYIKLKNINEKIDKIFQIKIIYSLVEIKNDSRDKFNKKRKSDNEITEKLNEITEKIEKTYQEYQEKRKNNKKAKNNKKVIKSLKNRYLKTKYDVAYSQSGIRKIKDAVLAPSLPKTKIKLSTAEESIFDDLVSEQLFDRKIRISKSIEKIEKELIKDLRESLMSQSKNQIYYRKIQEELIKQNENATSDLDLVDTSLESVIKRTKRQNSKAYKAYEFVKEKEIPQRIASSKIFKGEFPKAIVEAIKTANVFIRTRCRNAKELLDEVENYNKKNR